MRRFALSYTQQTSSGSSRLKMVSCARLLLKQPSSITISLGRKYCFRVNANNRLYGYYDRLFSVTESTINFLLVAKLDNARLGYFAGCRNTIYGCFYIADPFYRNSEDCVIRQVRSIQMK